MTPLSPAAAQVLARAQTEPWRVEVDDNEQPNIYDGEAWVALLPHECLESHRVRAEGYAEAITAAVNSYWQHARDQRALAEAREAKGHAYHERNLLVAYLAGQYPSHIKLHPAEDTAWEADWRTIICVHGPTGQMTWHVHDSEAPLFGFLNRKPMPDFEATCTWDGHTTEEKYQRLASIGGATLAAVLEEG